MNEDKQEGDLRQQIPLFSMCPTFYADNFTDIFRRYVNFHGRYLSGGVMVAQGPLEAFVMVRIHAGQPKRKRCFSSITTAIFRCF
jgi:hypothetical protein